MVIDLHGILVSLIHGVENQRDNVPLEINLVDQISELVVLFALFLDHALDVCPRDT